MSDADMSDADPRKPYENPGLETSAPAVEPLLLRACSLLFFFRTLATSPRGPEAHSIELQIVKLIGDLIPVRAGSVLLGWGEEALRSRARERSDSLEDLVARVTADGLITDAAVGSVAVPIYARDQIAGLISVSIEPALAGEAAGVLSGIGVLAAAAVETAREIEALRSENEYLAERAGTDDGIAGESAAVHRLRDSIARVAPRDTSVLILGESGTGKELVARALHAQSRRRHGPFIAVNCAALNENLLESELFGHEKGAFTGAPALKKGRFERAEGGTIFLDEIGELAPALQAKLLRVLQEREFERVGGTRSIPLDVRLIAATNRDLASDVRAGSFRQDLYHRLNVVTLRTAPLRERPEDILVLARLFLRRIASRCGRRVLNFSPEAARLLEVYSWPGNVRELENAIEHAIVLGAAEQVLPEDLPEAVSEASDMTEACRATFQTALGNARRESVMHAWRQARGDYRAAASLLGVHPNSLLRMIRTLGLRDSLKPG